MEIPIRCTAKLPTIYVFHRRIPSIEGSKEQGIGTIVQRIGAGLGDPLRRLSFSGALLGNA